MGAVGTMTIAAFAGANGLGWFIMLGMNSLNYPMTVMGAVASAVMALTLDYLLGRVERALTSEGVGDVWSSSVQPSSSNSRPVATHSRV